MALDNTKVVNRLRKLYREEEDFQAVFDDFAARKQRQTELTAERLMSRTELPRASIIRVFRELHELDLGRFVLGRSGHSSRFEFTADLISIGQTATEETSDVEEIDDSELEIIPDDDEEELVEHSFRLRKDLNVTLSLPPDLTAHEAERLGAYLKTLVLEPEPRQGLGTSESRPTGRTVSLPRRIAGAIRGGASNGTRVGSGHGHVEVGIRFSSGSTETTVVLPPGFVMTAKGTNYQNGLLVQEVRIVVPANEDKQWRLSMYCANRSRKPADEEAEFTIGPVVVDPSLHELFALLADKRIESEEETALVQDAVWEITDGSGLTPQTREAIREL